jgi:hypothetical protein
MVDYKNGKIYVIRNTINDNVYVGSTSPPLSKRMAKHRGDASSKSKSHYILYKAFNELCVDNFYIELVEECPCENV